MGVSRYEVFTCDRCGASRWEKIGMCDSLDEHAETVERDGWGSRVIKQEKCDLFGPNPYRTTRVEKELMLCPKCKDEYTELDREMMKMTEKWLEEGRNKAAKE